MITSLLWNHNDLIMMNDEKHLLSRSSLHMDLACDHNGHKIRSVLTLLVSLSTLARAVSEPLKRVYTGE